MHGASFGFVAFGFFIKKTNVSSKAHIGTNAFFTQIMMLFFSIKGMIYKYMQVGEARLRSTVALLFVILLSGCATTNVGSLYRTNFDANRAESRGSSETKKNIFVTIDGTGNSAISRTNAAKLFELVDSNSGQKRDRELATYYGEGVGSRGEILGLAAGAGISADVRSAYDFLTQTYEPGDRIFLSGFSRGAYAIRILNGLIAVAGIPDLSYMPPKERKALIRRVYRAYKTSPKRVEPSVIEHNERRYDNIENILRKKEIPMRGGNGETRIQAMAIWDTVEALGAPDRTEDPTERLDHYYDTVCNIDHVFHALALDDNRSYSFTPIFTTDRAMTDGCGGKASGTVQEVWFSGAHADVGGSYAPNNRVHGFLPGVSLNWMLQNLEKFDLFPKKWRVFEDKFGPIHDAKKYSAVYKGLSENYRDPLKYQYKAGLKAKPKVHISAIERLLVAKELDSNFDQCPRREWRKGMPVLICYDNLLPYGFIPELKAGPIDQETGLPMTSENSCIAFVDSGIQLIPGQQCIDVVCDTGQISDGYCYKQPSQIIAEFRKKKRKLGTP